MNTFFIVLYSLALVIGVVSLVLFFILGVVKKSQKHRKIWLITLLACIVLFMVGMAGYNATMSEKQKAELEEYYAEQKEKKQTATIEETSSSVATSNADLAVTAETSATEQSTEPDDASSTATSSSSEEPIAAYSDDEMKKYVGDNTGYTISSLESEGNGRTIKLTISMSDHYKPTLTGDYSKGMKKTVSAVFKVLSASKNYLESTDLMSEAQLHSDPIPVTKNDFDSLAVQVNYADQDNVFWGRYQTNSFAVIDFTGNDDTQVLSKAFDYNWVNTPHGQEEKAFGTIEKVDLPEVNYILDDNSKADASESSSDASESTTADAAGRPFDAEWYKKNSTFTGPNNQKLEVIYYDDSSFDVAINGLTMYRGSFSDYYATEDGGIRYPISSDTEQLDMIYYPSDNNNPLQLVGGENQGYYHYE